MQDGMNAMANLFDISLFENSVHALFFSVPSLFLGSLVFYIFFFFFVCLLFVFYIISSVKIFFC